MNIMDLNNTDVLSFSSVGQKFNINCTRVKLRYGKVSFLSGDSKGSCISLLIQFPDKIQLPAFIELRYLFLAVCELKVTPSFQRLHVVRLGPTRESIKISHIKIFNLNQICKSFLTCKVTYLQVPGIGVWTSLKGHHSAYHNTLDMQQALSTKYIIQNDVTENGRIGSYKD